MMSAEFGNVLAEFTCPHRSASPLPYQPASECGSVLTKIPIRFRLSKRWQETDKDLSPRVRGH